MGVIHKLKKEVVDYIVNAKKENPSSGCRALAELASKEFEIKISKSSVNTILKKALLSNQVGRRFQKKNAPKELKFIIPEQKKNQLFKSLPSNISVDRNSIRIKKRPDLKKEIDKLLLAEQQFKGDGTHELEQRREEAIPVISKKEPHIPDRKMRLKDSKQNPFWREKKHQEFLQYVRTLKREYEQRMSPVFPNMGMVFVRAAEWELNRGAFWQELFQSTSRLWSKNLPDALSLLTMLKVIKQRVFLDSLEDTMSFVSAQTELFQCILNYKEVDLNREWATLNQQQISEQILFEYKMRKREVFLGTAFVELNLVDGTKYFINFSQFTVHTAPPPINTSTLLKSIEDVTKYIISNQDVFYVSSLDVDVPHLHSFLKVFFSVSTQEVKQINICSSNQQPLATFDVFPRMKRRVVIGINPKQKSRMFLNVKGQIEPGSSLPYVCQYQEGLAMLNRGDFKAIYHNAYDEVFYYKEGLIPISEKNGEEVSFILKGISIWNEKRDKEICTLITNDLSQETEDVLFSYLCSWRNFAQIDLDVGYGRKEDNCEMPEASFDMASMDQGVISLIESYAQDLILYTLKRFFPDLYFKYLSNEEWEDAFAALLSLRGKFCKTDNEVNVNLCESRVCENSKLLRQACQRLNAAHIKTQENKLLFIDF
ncbi:MAG: hypothetical protein K8S27_06130 [Candidatus Omnitrophica bacterium]|nr:hypothetical protein [Candidatus Omnitrophota bacterium]